MPEQFPKRLRELREKHGMTRKALGERCGVSKGQIGRYESGERVPNIYTTKHIAHIFGVTMDYLCGEEKKF